MNQLLTPICAAQTPCKCCAGSASLYGVVDFHKNCEIHRRKVLDVSGIPIYYYRCPRCHFIFTTAFDHWTREDFGRYIYNEEYLQVDPEYEQVRPRAHADLLCRLFAGSKPQRILDYGGGSGLLASLLLASGFANVDTYDPFVPRFSTRPQGRYDCIVSIEVAEHSTDPVHTFAEMNDLMSNPGMILFTTVLQPADIDQQQLSWWYAGPRNGHVSLYSRASLEALARPHGFKLGSINDNAHVFCKEIPQFLKPLVCDK